MRRREFMRLVGGAPMAWLAVAQAQESDKFRKFRIGILSEPTRQSSEFVFDGLRKLGLVEGRHYTVDERGLGVRPDRFSPLAGELVEFKVDLIMCVGAVAIRAAQQATTTIPIVGGSPDMLEAGLVRSLSRPEGNTTGFSTLASDLDGKRGDILFELVPDSRRIAFLVDPAQTSPRQHEKLKGVMEARGVDVSIHLAAKSEEIKSAVRTVKTSGATALNVLASPLFAWSPHIIELTASLRLPTVYQWAEMSERGGLAAYGPRYERVFGDILARQIAKILRGTKVADVPVEQPTAFEFVINLKTANAIGLSISPTMLARADKVIE